MFELNGIKYSNEQLQEAAVKYNMDFDSYLDTMKQKGLTEVDTEIEGNEKQMEKEILFNKINTDIYSNLYNIPKPLVPFITGLSGFVTRNISGGASLIEGAYESAIGMTKEEMKEDGVNLLTKTLDEITEAYDSMGILKYDEDTKQKADFYGLVEDGRLADAAELATYQAVSSAPSVALSIAFPVFGSMTLGATVAGESFKESIKNRPDQTLENIWYNSLVKGGSEFGAEFLGGKLARYTMGIGAGKEKVVKEFSENFIKSAGKKAGLGFLFEGGTETLTDIGQQAADQFIFGDPKSTGDYIRGGINSFVIGGLMGGVVTGGSRVTQGRLNTKAQQEKLIHFLAPKQFHERQMQIAKEIQENYLDLKQAKKDGNKQNIEFFENNQKKLTEQSNKNKKDLYAKFEALSNKEKLQYGKNEDAANKLLNIINNTNYSEQARANAENQIRNFYQQNFDLLGDTNLDVGVETAIGEALKASEAISERLKKTKGINRDDLKIVRLKNNNQIEALPKEIQEGVKKSDGMFLAKDKDGKATIYINENIAAIASATNVLGHELFHYMISRRFKTDNASMQPFINELKNYLQKNNPDAYSRIQRRIDQFYTNPDGTIKKDALEEYMAVFSDLLDKKLIDLKELESKGLRNELKDIAAGFGYGEFKLNTAQDFIKFIQTYNKNINRKGLLGKLMGTKILDVKLTSDKLVEIERKDVKKADTKQEKQRYSDDTVPVKRETFTQTMSDGTKVKYRAITRLDGSVYFQSTVQGESNFTAASKKLDIKAGDNITPKQRLEVIDTDATITLDKTEDYKSVMNPKMFDRLTSDQQQRVDPKRARQTKKSVSVKKSITKDLTDAQKEKRIIKIGRKNEFGDDLEGQDGNAMWKSVEGDDAARRIQEEGLLDGLILSQYKKYKTKLDEINVNKDTFLNTTYTELLSHIRNYQPERKNPNGLFGWINPQLSNKSLQAFNVLMKGKEKAPTVDIGQTTKEGEVKVQVAAETDAATKAFETEDLSITGQAKKKASEAKAAKQKESAFRNKVGFKTGSQIYNEILNAAKKSLIRAYGKTQNIKDATARERAVVEELQKEHNSLTSPLFKQIKNWLGYGKPQEVVAKGTKDIYLDNLREFREDIVKLISTADLVQIERLVAESDRVFTRYKETLTKIADVQKAVDNFQLPPDAMNKILKGQPVRLYEKVIPGETEIVDFADQPGSIPSKKDPTKMVRSGLKGTRKDGISKNIVNGLVLDAVMEARQSEEVQSKAKEMGVDTKSVEQLSALIGRPSDVKFSKSITDTNISNLKNILGKEINYTKLMGPSQIRKSRIAIQNIIDSIDPQGIHSSIIPAFETLKNNIELGLSFATIIDTTWNKLKEQGVGNYQMQALLHEGVFSKKHLNNLLAKAKRLTEVQIRQIAFQDAVTELQNNVAKAKTKDKKVEIIKNWLINNSKSARTSKVIYNGETITTNEQMFEEVIKPLGSLGFAVKPIKEGTKITHDNKSLNTYKKIIEIKQDPASSTQIVKDEADQAKKWFFNILKSKISPEAKKARISLGAIDMVGPIRKMAELVGYITNAKGKTTLEHRVTINEITKAANEYIDNPTDQNLKAVEKQVNNSKVFLLPNDIVDVINKDYKTTGDLKTIMNLPEVKQIIDKKGYEFVNNTNIKFSRSQERQTVSKAVMFSRSTNNPTQGITVLDFDDTLATTQSLVKFTRPDGTTGTLNAEQYASTYENLLDQGYTFDFSDFNKVVKGKLAPLFNKAMKLQSKFGPKNMFVLTARPPAAQKAIFDFLKANGLNIPLKNITGLGNSTAEAKALWMAGKVSEGYNDFYFADDALQNVQAVKNMLEQFDVKSKVQQAKIKFSKSMDSEFNKILEEVTGIEAKKRFSDAKARKRGEGKGRFRMFIPPSHEDFVGLLYNFIGEGEKGNKHRDFFEKALIQPLNRAYRELNMAKQAIANDYKKLTKQMPDIRKKLIQKTPDGDFTYDDAVRVYLWDKFGFDIPGLTKTDTKKLVDYVNSDGKLKTFADTIGLISKMEKGYTEPGEHWLAGSIKQDLADATGRVGRAKFFTEFIENSNQIFGKLVNGKLTSDNANKIRAAFGDNFVEALEDMLYAVQNGTNRKQGGNKQVNAFLDYLNGSVGATMFFNARSAVLQTLSTVNFINFADNNIFKAAARFADQPQFWSDFSKLFNSDYLKQRRAGVGFDVNGAEIAAAVKKAKNPVKAAIAYILNKGFLPTQMADSFAIALGGSSMYRNRVNTYIKKGLSKSEAETKAFEDFQAVAESTQQSARPDMLSQLQRSALGRMIFAFQNVTSQYARLIKKSGLDLINRRKSPPYTTQVQSDMSNISKIIYYGAIQNFIFYSLQSALFAMSFEDDEDEDKRNEKFFKTKKQRLINGSMDSILRGSGLPGAILSVIKNAVIKYGEQNEKGWGRKLGVISDELLQISPPVGIKIRKLDSFEKTMAFNQKVIPEMDTFDLDNPIWDAYGNLIEGATNIPVARLNRKVENVRSALNSENAWWQRLALGLGWSKWELGIEDKEINEVKKQINRSNKSANPKKFKKIKFK